MSEATTQDRLNEALDFILQTAQDGKSFVLDQAPEVAKEIVAWEFWGSVARAAFCMAIFVIAMCVLFKAIGLVRREFGKNVFEQCEGLIMGGILATVVSAVVCFVSGAGVGVNGGLAIRAHVAPRLVVLDYVKGVVR